MSPYSILSAMVQACRPLNMLLAASAVLTGALLSGGLASLALPGVLLATAATVLALAAGNLWNDLADQTEDAQNRPDRPLPSGRLSAVQVRRVAALLALVALALALAQGLPGLALVAVCLGSLAWYASHGKQAGLLGNLAVAVLATTAVCYGAVSVSWAGLENARPIRALVPALLAGVLHLLRELVKDAQDKSGDRAARRRTWVLAATPPMLRRLLAQLAVLSFIPPLMALLLGKAPPALRAAHLVAIFVAPLLLRGVLSADLENPAALRRLSRLCKILLALGLAMYTIASLVQE